VIAENPPRRVPEGAAVKHVLKCWPHQWEQTYLGDKTCEWRRDDRDYDVGDELVLLEWDPASAKYSGRGLVMKVTHILRGRFGVPDGYCVMSTKFVGETSADAHGIAKRDIRR